MRRLVFSICLLVALTSLTACPGLSTMMRQYGYKDIRPASTLFAPGTIVWVRNKSPFQAGVICTANEALGSDFKPMASATMNSAIKKYASRGFNFEAQFLSQISSDNVLSSISSIQMQLSNPRIFEVRDSDIRQRVARGSINPWCIDAIAARRAEGYRVTMISSALQGDISYTIDWNSTAKLTADAKVAALKNLSLQMGLESSKISESSFTATGLYLGIIEDRGLAYLFDSDHLPALPVGSRLLPPNKSIEIPDPAASDFSGSPPLPDASWLPPSTSSWSAPVSSSQPVPGGLMLDSGFPRAFDPAQAPWNQASNTASPAPSDASGAGDDSASAAADANQNLDDGSASDPSAAQEDDSDAPSVAADSNGALMSEDIELGGSGNDVVRRSPPPKGSFGAAVNADGRQSMVASPPPAKGAGGNYRNSQLPSSGTATTGEDEEGPEPPVLPLKRLSIVPTEYLDTTSHHGQGHGRKGISGAQPGQSSVAPSSSSQAPSTQPAATSRQRPTTQLGADADSRSGNPYRGSMPPSTSPRQAWTQSSPDATPTPVAPSVGTGTRASRVGGAASNPYRGSQLPSVSEQPASTTAEQDASSTPSTASTSSSTPSRGRRSPPLRPQQQQAPQSTAPAASPSRASVRQRPVTGVPASQEQDDSRRHSGSSPGYF